MRPPFGRIGPFVRARPRRSAALAAVLVLLLVAAIAIVPGERSRPEGPAGEAAPQDARGPDSLPGSETTSPGDGQPGTGGVPGGTSESTTTPAQAGPSDTGTPPPSVQPAQPGTAAPGAAGVGGGGTGAEGAEPVEPRRSLRCASTGAPTAGPLPSSDERDGRRWVAVGRLAGNCDASSTPFMLQGIDTRLVWRSDADSFAVFVVDVVQGREAAAGFADGQCAGACSESQPVVPAAGTYRLEVQAGDAPWEVEIQEYRRP